ncbi:MAG: collagen-like protein, partial [Bacteroidota bacterium]|nr:collagen-like protein [Bacteroidota bacterium]
IGLTGASGTNGATGATGLPGTNGTNGTNGATGATGPIGPIGLTGASGTNGATGATGLAGTNGTNGATGATGPIGLTGAPGSALAFADFFALMPGDNAATIAVSAAIQFPQTGSTNGSGITAIGGPLFTQFKLAAIGIYMVNWQVSVNEPGQLVIGLNGIELPATVVGRAAGTTQIVGMRLITTTIANSVLSIVNPTGNSTALTITPSAGGANPVSASLVILRLQ